jgi:SPP1 family predicted phage head-tail adaptor
VAIDGGRYLVNKAPVNVGKMRHRVTLEAPTPSRNQIGEEVQGWAAVADVWASVEPLSGRELWNAQQVQPDVTHRVRMWHRPDVRADWRLRHRGRVLNVVAVINREELNEALELVCREEA